MANAELGEAVAGLAITQTGFSSIGMPTRLTANRTVAYWWGQATSTQLSPIGPSSRCAWLAVRRRLGW